MKLYTTTYLIDGRLVEFTSEAENSDDHMDAVIEWAERVYPGYDIIRGYAGGTFKVIDERE